MSTPSNDRFTLSEIKALLENVFTYQDGITVSVTVHKQRCEGIRTDFAHGSITATVPTAKGPLIITSGWSAWPQTVVENGWYFEMEPERADEGVISDLPIYEVDEEEGVEQLLAPHGDELQEVAWEFWSFNDVDEPALLHLGNRLEAFQAVGHRKPSHEPTPWNMPKRPKGKRRRRKHWY